MNTEFINKALEACQSPHTRRSYDAALQRCATWLKDRALTYALAREYRAQLVQNGFSAQNVNQHLAALRFYVREMAKEGVLSIEEAQAICKVESLKIKGRKLGNWLTIEEAEKLLNQPDVTTALGLRDRAILALLIGAGLRRSEVVGLSLQHFERRDGRWMLIGVNGKHGRTRNVPIADWVKALVDQWKTRAQIKSGLLFRAVYETEDMRLRLRDEPLDPASLYYIVKRHGWRASRPRIVPHDLRRTFARLTFEGNAPIKQIQLALGHASQTTTEHYVNANQDLQISPYDLLGINVAFPHI
jgi:site-specific recombinase XerD